MYRPTCYSTCALKTITDPAGRFFFSIVRIAADESLCGTGATPVYPEIRNVSKGGRHCGTINLFVHASSFI
jgi:hypothetical protein